MKIIQVKKKKYYQYLLLDGVGCNRFREEVMGLGVTHITGKV